jgi:hypothetical protein
MENRQSGKYGPVIVIILFLSIAGLWALNRYDDKWDPFGDKKRGSDSRAQEAVYSLRCNSAGYRYGTAALEECVKQERIKDENR